MAKTNQIKKVVNGEIADADDVNQIVENAGNEGGSIPYEPVGHERDVLGSQSLGSTAYPYGTLSINRDSLLDEIETTSHTVADSVAIKNLRRFIYLKDCPSSYVGFAGAPLRCNALETGLEFTTAIGSEFFASNGTFTAPIGVTNCFITMCAGGGGGSKASGGYPGGGGGGGGVSIFRAQLSVVPGSGYAVTVGSGGTAGISSGQAGGNGGSSSVVGSILTLTAAGGAGAAGAGGAGGAATSPSLNPNDAVTTTGGAQGLLSFKGGNGAYGETPGGGGGGSMFGKGGNAGVAAVEYGGGGGNSTVGYKGFVLIEWFV